MENLRRFEGKTVVIAGASRGIGRGIALRFAREGANLVVGANEDRIELVAQEIRQMGRKSLGSFVDVTDKESVEAFYDAAVNEFGTIDVSIQNAGTITIARVEDMKEEEWDRVMSVNAKGVWLCCQQAARIMLKQGHGRIVNTASAQAREGFIYTPHYAASKMGVVGITQSLAKELASRNITVNAVCPGIVDSEMWAYNDREWGKLLGDYKPGELMKEWIDAIPMQRGGTPDDIAGLVSFLASEDASYITGQTINIDGGMRMN
jgi:meso-butanediol dehydrogenase/(S,S)-butanediol dehydrogenase/diacetyl reductase